MSGVYPVDHPLRSAQLKVERANVHIRLLEESINNWPKPEIIVAKYGEIREPGSTQAIGSTVTIHVDTVLPPEIREEWGLIIGDILTNLRASIDHIAWALASKYAVDSGTVLTPEDAERVVFPIRSVRVDAANCHIGGLHWNHVRFFDPAVHSIIEQFQPYHGSQRPKNWLLATTHNLVSTDKHRIVTPAVVVGRITVGDEHLVTLIGVKNHDEMMFMVPDGADKLSDEFKPQISPSVVVYPMGGFPVREVDIKEFALIYDFISDEVIPAFAGFF